MKLKNCPFCGSSGRAGNHKYYPEQYVAHCGGGGRACIFPSTGPRKTLQEAIDLWEMRTPNNKGETK